MKNKCISGFGMSYERLSKVMARKMFDKGSELLVMSIDRNPVESLTSPRVYKKGCQSYMMGCVGKSSIETFDDLMEDFIGKNYEKIARITSFGTDIGVYINRLRRKGRGNTCTG